MITLPAGENRVGLLGDTEGQQPHIYTAIEQFAAHAIRTVLQLGDFAYGLGPGGDHRVARQRLQQTNDWLDEADQRWLVTPGNHENWPLLNAIAPSDDGLQWVANRAAFIPRGHRWTWRDRDFLSLGGAPSINFDDLVEGVEWFPEEAITADDVDRVTAGGGVDIFLCHDSPSPGTPAVEQVIASNPLGFGEVGLAYAEEGRERLSRAVHATQPRLVAHGHMHVYDRTVLRLPGVPHDIEVVSLDAVGFGHRSAAILDLDTLAVEVL